MSEKKWCELVVHDGDATHSRDLTDAQGSAILKMLRANEVRRANRAEEALRDMVQQAEEACSRLNKAENRHNQHPQGDTAPYYVDMRLAGPICER